MWILFSQENISKTWLSIFTAIRSASYVFDIWIKEYGFSGFLTTSFWLFVTYFLSNYYICEPRRMVSMRWSQRYWKLYFSLQENCKTVSWFLFFGICIVMHQINSKVSLWHLVLLCTIYKKYIRIKSDITLVVSFLQASSDKFIPLSLQVSANVKE